MASPLRRRGVRALTFTVSAALTLATAAGAPAHAATASTQAKPTNAAAKHTTNLTEDQASAQAHKTGKPVPVVGDTTAYSTVTANPNGTFTQTTSNQPVRAQVDGTWQNLDATLVKTADGGYAPKVAVSRLEISGGGSGPLARMAHDATGLSLNLPTGIDSLPTPSVSGATATYQNVLPGVDLQVTVNDQGGFSEVLVVKTAKAATDPALATLSFPAGATGVHLATEADGGITATSKSGQIEYTAPAATMWDSATNPTVNARAVTATNNITHAKEALDPNSGTPAYSSSTAAGAGAHTASLKAHYAGGRITLTADANVLHGAKTVYPVYIDPSYNAVDPRQNWTYIRSDFPTQSSNFDTKDSDDTDQGDLRVGYSQNDETGAWFNAESMVQMGINESTLHTATIWSSTLYTEEEWSYSCTASEVDLYQVNGINSGTDWNNFNKWSNPGDWPTAITSKPLANRYGDTSCPASSIGWDVTNQIKSAVAADKGNITFGLTAPDESNSSEWHRFATTVTQTTTYNHTPNKPTSLHTSPATQCTTSNPDTVGLGNVTLYAGVSDPDGGTVYAYFKLWNTSTGATVATTNALAQGSGTTATFNIAKSDFNQTAKTEYSWDVYITDGPAGNNQTISSPLSSTCDFYYDPTVPGAPNVTASSAGYQVGQPGTFTITPGSCPAGASGCTTSPTSYIYQLNASDPITVASQGASTQITVKPTTQTFTLTVTAQSAGGNMGEPAPDIFFAEAAAPTSDKDLNGDAISDLVTTGQTDLGTKTFNDPDSTTGNGAAKTGYVPQADTGSSTPAGLWLDDGNGTDGQLATGAADIGAYGNGLTDPRVAANFTGTESITGNFTTDNFQDLLEYNPVTGTGAVIGGSGDGSALQTTDTGNISNIDSDTLADAVSTEDPLQVANAYTSVNNNGFPDLVGINGDDGSGYYLDYYASFAAAGQYANGVELSTGSGFGAAPIAAPSGAWNTWTIYSAQIGGSTNLILWQPSTGLLYDWAGFSYNPNTGTVTVAETYELSGNFDTGATTVAELEAASTPDGNLLIYTVRTDGTVNADEFTNLSASGTATDTATVKSQPLTTAAHDWALNDYGKTPNTATDDNTSTQLNLTGTGGVTSHTGDVFDPDVNLSGASGTDLTASTKAIDLTQSFTVSLWAKPTVYNGRVALSQDGTNYSGLMLYPTNSGWDFYLAKDNGTTAWGGDSVIGGTVELDQWAYIQATYNAGTKVMELYVDNTLVGTGSHTAPGTGATGAFRLGADKNNGAANSFWDGQLAQVQTWGGVALAPNQPITPAAYHQAINPERLLDTRLTTPATNPDSGAIQNGTPVGAYGTLALKIAGDTVTPADATTTTTIPANVTAVAVDVTVVAPAAGGNLSVYPDGSQVPITSSTNFQAATTITGYQIVPVGPDGKIALYNASPGTAHFVVDITGYYAPDPNHLLTADQTYHPLPVAQRILDTRSGTGATKAKLAPGASITLHIAGVDGIPANAATVAINLTAADESGSGIIQAYQAGTALNTKSDTTLTYGSTSSFASLAADVNLGTGSNAGEITVTNTGTATTDVIGDVQGYFTNDDTGQLYYTVNPTRLVDTRNGIGGKTGAIASVGTYKLNDTGQTDAGQITTAPTPTFALQVTVAASTDGGALNVYPDPTKPATSNLNWATGQSISNLALVQPGTDNTIDFYNDNAGTTQLIVDTSGYFAGDPFATAHDWQLNDGTGTTADDTAGNAPLNLNGTYNWTTSSLGSKTGQTVLNLDGTSAYGTTNGPAVNTTGSFTVSAWAELSSLSTSSYATVVAQSGTQASGFYLQYNASWQGWCLNFMQSDTANTGGLADVPCTYGAPAVGTWYYLVGTYDAASHTAALYVNGALVNRVTGISPWAASGNLTVGAGQYDATLADFFPGEISNVQTYNYALSTAQVGEIYQQNPQAGSIYDRVRSTSGTWNSFTTTVDTAGTITRIASTAMPDGTWRLFTLVPGYGVYDDARDADDNILGLTRVDANGAITAIASATLPDGTVHLFTLVPGSGVYDRVRSAAGIWADSATQIDTAGTITAISAASQTNGTLHLFTVVPGYGAYDRTLATNGTWSSTTKIDTNGAITAVSSAGLTDGTLHVQTLVPGSGVYDRTLATSGTWGGSTTQIDTSGSITAISAVGLPDGTLHVQTLVPGYGAYDRTLATNGTWSSTTKFDTSGSLTYIAAAGLTDGTLHVQTIG